MKQIIFLVVLFCSFLPVIAPDMDMEILKACLGLEKEEP